jgi:hypothetical protein
MKLLPSGICVLALLCLPAVAAGPQKNKLAPEVTTILQKAEQFQLLSLDPEPTKQPPKNAFHDYKVLGSTAIKKAAVRKEVVSALLKGMEGTIDPARCFNPRHGIVATHAGKTVELVICFECQQLDVYAPAAKEARRLLINQMPAQVFNRVLKGAGVPLAKE